MNIFSVSLKNLKRKPSRTWLLFGAVVVVSCTLFTATLCLKSMDNALRIIASRFGADIVVVPQDAKDKAQAAFLRGEPSHFLMDNSVLDEVRKLAEVKHATPQLYIKPNSAACCFSADVAIVGFDPETDVTVTPWLERNLKRKLGSNEILIGKKVTAHTGERISFFGTPFIVAGVLEAVGSDFFDNAVFMTLDAAYEMAQKSRTMAVEPIDIGRDKISAVLVQTETLSSRISAAFKINHDLKGVSSLVTGDVMKPVKKQFGGLIKTVLITGAVLWTIVLLILGFAFSVTAHERQRETGLLRAMGANRSHIAALFLNEAVLLTGGGGVAGVALGYSLILMLRGPLLHYLNLPFVFPSAAVLAGLTAEALALSVLSGMLAALVPSISIIRMSPYVMIATGE